MNTDEMSQFSVEHSLTNKIPLKYNWVQISLQDCSTEQNMGYLFASPFITSKCGYSREGEAVAGLFVTLALWLDCLLRVRQRVRDARQREKDHDGVPQHRGWFLLSDKHPAD